MSDNKQVSNTGHRRPPNAGKGRPKGSPNKVTASVKAMLEGALKEVGGQQFLVEQARENPVAFLGLIKHLIPSELKAELTGKDGSPLVFSEDQLLRMADEIRRRKG
jgi:hypothetical protein